MLLLLALVLLVFFGLNTLYRADEVLYDALLGRYLPWVDVLEMDRIPLLVLAGVSILLPVFYLGTALMQARLERGIVGRGADGEEISLTPESIEKRIVRELRRNIAEVSRVRHCTARQGRSGVLLSLELAVSDKNPIPHVKSQVEQLAQDTLTRTIGYANAEVRVKVAEIRTSGPRGRRRSRRGTDDDE